MPRTFPNVFLLIFYSSFADRPSKSVLRTRPCSVAFCASSTNVTLTDGLEPDASIPHATYFQTSSGTALIAPNTMHPQPLRPPRARSRSLRTVTLRWAPFGSGLSRFLSRLSIILNKNYLGRDS